MPADYSQYREDVTSDITACTQSMQCQPILFLGSGVSRRYFNGPSWAELLERLIANCPLIDKPFAYFWQKYQDYIEIGEQIAKAYLEWAWGDGCSRFPPEMFAGDTHPHDFVKYEVATILQSLTPTSVDALAAPQATEIELLRRISPHAIITTNYDTFLETLFPEFTPVIGETILRASYASVGEILKIHGCVSKPDSIVLTRKDYDAFIQKRKYLSAKLLTYFAEHPLLFIGYNATDPNIVHILSDIEMILAAQGDLIPNVYILEWKTGIDVSLYPTRERVIHVQGDRTVRVKSIAAESFDWVFQAFACESSISKVNVKLLRCLMARTCEIVRHDIPRRTIEVDFAALEHAVETSENLAHVLGIQTIANTSLLNADFPFTLTEVARQLGKKYWHYANVILEKIKAEHEVDIKASDNRYHLAIKMGQNVMHKYSCLLVDLLRRIERGEDVTIPLPKIHADV